MYIEFGRRVQRKKVELVEKYIFSLKKTDDSDPQEVITVELEEIKDLFKKNNISVPDSTDPDPEIILILFYLSNPWKSSPVLKIMGTVNEGFCFVKI